MARGRKKNPAVVESRYEPQTEEFVTAEKLLVMKYHNLAIVRGSLRVGTGPKSQKRVVDLTCSCGQLVTERATSDLWTFKQCSACPKPKKTRKVKEAK